MGVLEAEHGIKKRGRRQKKSIKTKSVTTGNVKTKRGTTKGSTKKPKPVPVTTTLPWSDDDDEVVDLNIRARKTWIVGQELGLVFKGTEETTMISRGRSTKII